MKTKLSGKFFAVLTIFSLMGQIAWVVENMYFNVFIYKMFSASASDISLMVSASAVAATLTTVFMGALSDRVGKRKLFMCGGYILWGISIFSFVLIRADVLNSIIPATVSAASVGISLTIILDCVMTFFGSTANDAAFNAWLTDSTDNTNRGKAEGINAMMPLMAILVVFGGFMAFDLNSAQSWTVIFSIIGGLTLLVGVLGIFIIKDPVITRSESGLMRNVFYGFRPSTIAKNSTLYRSLILFILFNISIQIFMPYLILYYEVSLKMADYVLIMAPAIIIASAVTFVWGRVYDKLGFKPTAVVSLIWLILGYVILSLFKTTLPVFLGSLLMMCGYLSGMAVFGADIRDKTPTGRAGSLQGVRIFSQVLIPGVVGPYIGTLVLSNAEMITNNDGTTSFIPNQGIFVAALAVAVIVLAAVIFAVKKQPPKTAPLTTPFEGKVGDIPLAEHPRPAFKRQDYLCLNGSWGLEIINKKGSESHNILVPFPPQSKMSGIQRSIAESSLLVYKKSFTLPDFLKGKRVVLHFDGVDAVATVFLNGKVLGKNVGGYLPFEFDVTDLLLEENELKVEVKDENDTELAYGKQRKKRGGMWYTPISGIWQTVWLEGMPQNPISNMKLTTTLNTVTIQTTGGAEDKVLTLLGDQPKTYKYTGDSITLTVEDPENWTPENPKLYYFELTDGDDRISSYFALRTVEIKMQGKYPVICLNGRPYFFNGLLDQGYFSDGIYLPATYEGYKNDILQMKSLGFNMLRKHIKIEPQIFYYYCDRYGMAVFQDMVNSGKYSFVRDTALPTVGFKNGPLHKATQKRKARFERDSLATLELLQNHPSVVQYTIFNEGWGQYDRDKLYTLLKTADPTRLYDTASGWFYPTKSDFQSEHIYFKPIRLKGDGQRPLFLSEFGGYSCKIDGHSFNLEKNYGYGKFATAEELEKALCRLFSQEVLPAVKNGLAATVLTQVSDVEDETNGLLTYDRQVLKVSPNALSGVFSEINEAFKGLN